jgi:L,D-transpeptidase catalytic domain
LQRTGATITWSDDGMQALVASDHTKTAISFASKRVEVDLANQRLRAYQGARLVLDSAISTGREGKKTPSGEFTAGPVKSRMHRSRLYHNAPMPWSVQVHENIFIHGFRKVPRRPASHGCIRLPLTGANPAKWFYNWIDLGTPISIKGHGPAATSARVEKSASPAHPFLPKVVIIATVVTIACFTIILFVSRRRGNSNESLLSAPSPTSDP